MLKELSSTELIAINGGQEYESNFPLQDIGVKIGHAARKLYNDIRDFFIGLKDGWTYEDRTS